MIENQISMTFNSENTFKTNSHQASGTSPECQVIKDLVETKDHKAIPADPSVPRVNAATWANEARKVFQVL